MIGVGNMGAAIIRGVAENLLPNDHIYITDLFQSKVDELCDELGVRSASDIETLIDHVDVILYAAKPNNAPDIATQIAKKIRDDQLIISIAAGVPIERFETFMPEKIAVIRVMPNIAATVGAGVAAISAGKNATDYHVSIAKSIFDAVGTSIVVDEKQLNAVTGLSGSGPAFVFLFIEALIDAGVHVGLARSDAETLAIQTVFGASQLLAESREHPAIWKNRVTTPAGTTASGLFELEKGNFRSVIKSAVIAATDRASDLALIKN